MTTREKRVQELMDTMRSLKRCWAFHAEPAAKLPRITPAQWGVLMLLEEQGSATVKEVAQALGITSSAATQLVDGLVTSRYVVRESDARDRRAVQLVLSKKTKAQVEAMKGQMMQKFLKLFAILSDKEFDQYVFLNKKIVAGFSKKII